MKCGKCDRKAVTSHGALITTHGYCEAHRCCFTCGLGIKTECKCEQPKERFEYLEYLQLKQRKCSHTLGVYVNEDLGYSLIDQSELDGGEFDDYLKNRDHEYFEHCPRCGIDLY